MGSDVAATLQIANDRRVGLNMLSSNPRGMKASFCRNKLLSNNNLIASMRGLKEDDAAMLANQAELTASPRDSRMRRIRRLSSGMALGCAFLGTLLTAAMAFFWATTPAGTLLGHAGLAAAGGVEIGATTRLIGFLVAMLPLGAMMFGLMRARDCFRAFAAGRVFAAEPIRDLRLFALATAASAALKPLAGAGLSLLLSSAAPSGTKALVLTVGSDSLLALVFAGTVAVIAWVMAEAAAIADENAQFV